MNYHIFRKTFSPLACFSTNQVKAAFPGFDRGNYAEWTRHGYLVRLRRGWYAFSESAKLPGISDYIAGKIYSPCYISCETVLSRCGLIPESVVQHTCVSTLKTAHFRNDFGEFSYRTLKPDLFFGFETETVGSGLPVPVATPAKALCDWLYLNPQYRTPQDLLELRLDPEILAGLFCDGSIAQTASRFSNPRLRDRVTLLGKTYGI